MRAGKRLSRGFKETVALNLASDRGRSIEQYQGFVVCKEFLGIMITRLFLM